LFLVLRFSFWINFISPSPLKVFEETHRGERRYTKLSLSIKVIKFLIFCNASFHFLNKLILLSMQFKVFKKLTGESLVLRKSPLWSYKIIDCNASFYFPNILISLYLSLPLSLSNTHTHTHTPVKRFWTNSLLKGRFYPKVLLVRTLKL